MGLTRILNRTPKVCAKRCTSGREQETLHELYLSHFHLVTRRRMAVPMAR